MAISRQARVTLSFHAQICSKNALRVQVKMILKPWHIETDPQGVPKRMRTLYNEKSDIAQILPLILPRNYPYPSTNKFRRRRKRLATTYVDSAAAQKHVERIRST